MRLLNADDLIKNNVDTINQFKILQYLKSNLNIMNFNVFLYNRNTIKVVDKNNEVGYFQYDEKEKNILFSEDIQLS